MNNIDIFREIQQTGLVDLDQAGCRKFIKQYMNEKPQEADWLKLCKDAKKYRCYKLVALFLIKILEKKLYKGSHSQALYSKLAIFGASLYSSTLLGNFFCGEKIEKLVTIQYEKNTRILYFECKNLFLKEKILEFLTFQKDRDKNFNIALELFEESLGKYKNQIQSIQDFSFKTLLAQCNFYKKYFSNDIQIKKRAYQLHLAFIDGLLKHMLINIHSLIRLLSRKNYFFL